MSATLFYVFFILASFTSGTYKTKRQIWWAPVECGRTNLGVICDVPKTVITPYTVHNQGLPWHPRRQPSPKDAILASPYDSSAINSNPLRRCPPENFQCASPLQCIKAAEVCDGMVNCVDGSDETDCSCIDRLHRSRICDNYFDCPDGIDEVGCFGCENGYSCHYNEDEFIGHSRQSMCYTDTDKCDGAEHCLNGKDEKDCLVLVSKKASKPDPFVRSTDGYLYINFANKWYPVCVDLFNWTRDVCQMEQGVELRSEPTTSYEPFNSIGDNYMTSVKRSSGTIKQIVSNCSIPGVESANAILHVKCPDICGQPTHFENKILQNMRISGGKEAASGSHPWLVSLHLNGTFVCGGSIIEQKWILTAAHCLIARKKETVSRYDYMDVRAGTIRQNSFTPHEQTVRVSRVVIHDGFDMKTFASDIAIMELAEPLRYNRWVQPICLPTKERINSDRVPDWIKNYENMTCLAAGWGSFTFRGPTPVGHVMEVQLRIVGDCDPTNPSVFCAGYPEGGFDTCYGDSGGPFSCMSENDRTNFFLAGVTSHGYNPTIQDQDYVRCGESNTFTAFTRITLYSGYIEQMKGYANCLETLREKCPGRLCRSNKRCVRAVDGIVDCITGEDETN